MLNLLTYLESQIRNSEQPCGDLGILNGIAALTCCESWLSRRKQIYGTRLSPPHAQPPIAALPFNVAWTGWRTPLKNANIAASSAELMSSPSDLVIEGDRRALQLSAALGSPRETIAKRSLSGITKELAIRARILGTLLV